MDDHRQPPPEPDPAPDQDPPRDLTKPDCFRAEELPEPGRALKFGEPRRRRLPPEDGHGEAE